MNSFLNQQLWVALHLLYSNSSQALDIYQSFIARFKNEVQSNKRILVFRKLAHINRRIDPIQTAGPFSIFEEHKSQYWEDLYQKNQKFDLVILLGVVIFDFKIDELEQSLKISKQKVRFLLNRIFKSTRPTLPIATIASKNFSFRKFEDHSVTDFHVRENLVEYALNLLSIKEKQLIESGFEKYPHYLAQVNLYKKIIDDIKQTLNYDMSVEDQRITYLAAHTKTINESYIQRVRGVKLKNNKSLVGVSATAVIIFAVVFLRPQWVKNVFEPDSAKQVFLQEVQPQQIAFENNLEETENKVNLSEMSVGESSIKTLTNNMTNTTKSSVVENSKPSISTTQTASAQKAETPFAHDMAAKSVNKHGGLYRGSIEVTDLDQVTQHLVEKVVSIGGKKAGDVSLGWKKNLTTSYFHFMIATANLEDLKAYLNKFGFLSIHFEDHPRQVPEGTSRLIIEIKQR